MRLVIQRVKNASVTVGEECVGRIGPGMDGRMHGLSLSLAIDLIPVVSQRF